MRWKEELTSWTQTTPWHAWVVTVSLHDRKKKKTMKIDVVCKGVSVKSYIPHTRYIVQPSSFTHLPGPLPPSSSFHSLFIYPISFRPFSPFSSLNLPSFSHPSRPLTLSSSFTSSFIQPINFLPHSPFLPFHSDWLPPWSLPPIHHIIIFSPSLYYTIHKPSLSSLSLRPQNKWSNQFLCILWRLESFHECCCCCCS